MTAFLDKILIWAAARLPETDSIWIEDLRQEAHHVPQGFRRFVFLWGGVTAVVGAVMRRKVGPQRIGQALLSFALSVFCVGCLVFASRLEEPVIKMALYGLLSLYVAAAVLVVLKLDLMKRFTFFSSLTLGIFWIILGLPTFTENDLPMEVLRALSIEAAVIMFSLFIASSYLAWVEVPDHA